MTTFSIIMAAFAVITTLRILALEVAVRDLKYQRSDGVRGSVKVTRQLRDGLVDIELNR